MVTLTHGHELLHVSACSLRIQYCQAVTAYFSSKQLLPFVFAEQCSLGLFYSALSRRPCYRWQKRDMCEILVPLDMKGCICHFTKWQIHPFISNRLYQVSSVIHLFLHVLTPKFVAQLVLRTFDRRCMWGQWHDWVYMNSRHVYHSRRFIFMNTDYVK